MRRPEEADRGRDTGVSRKPVVVVSIEDDTGLLCVDILELCGEGFGFREFRRDPEDPHGWRATGLGCDCVLKDADLALKEARRSIAWLIEAAI